MVAAAGRSAFLRVGRRRRGEGKRTIELPAAVQRVYTMPDE